MLFQCYAYRYRHGDEIEHRLMIRCDFEIEAIGRCLEFDDRLSTRHWEIEPVPEDIIVLWWDDDLCKYVDVVDLDENI